MIVLIIMIPFSLVLGFGFVVAFMMSIKSGQYDDLETPAYRILKEETRTDLKTPSTALLGRAACATSKRTPPRSFPASANLRFANECQRPSLRARSRLVSEAFKSVLNRRKRYEYKQK